MDIIDNIPFGIGYYDLTLEGIKELKDISIVLKPFERRLVRLYVYGSNISEGSIISVDGRLESLVRSATVKLSTYLDKPKQFWGTSDVIFTQPGIKLYPVHIEVNNQYYTELNTNLCINISLQASNADELNELSYYGVLAEDGDYKVLQKPIEISSERTIVIDPREEGQIEHNLSYSNGESLVLLDDNTAIPYIVPVPVTVSTQAAMMKEDAAGFHLWDDDELVDWDTDIVSSASEEITTTYEPKDEITGEE